MILRISVNLVKFCVSELGEFWWRFFILLGERGVVAKEGLWMVLCSHGSPPRYTVVVLNKSQR
jgi:hypothetical protein